MSPKTHIYLIDAILYGDPSYVIDVLKHAVLPAMTLGLLTAGVFLRLVRVNLLQTMRSDYVEAARARGVPERRVMRKHAFRNAMIPVVTVMGLQIAVLLGGAVLTERDLRVAGPRLRARRLHRASATTSPCRASSPRSRSSSPSSAS